MVIIISIERKRERRNGAVDGEERYKRRRNLYFIRVGLVFICRSADFNVWRRSPTLSSLSLSLSLTFCLENEVEWARGGWEILYYVVLLTAVSSGYFLRGRGSSEVHCEIQRVWWLWLSWVAWFDGGDYWANELYYREGRYEVWNQRVKGKYERERGCVEVKECGLYVRSASCCCFFYFFLGMRINNEIVYITSRNSGFFFSY